MATDQEMKWGGTFELLPAEHVAVADAIRKCGSEHGYVQDPSGYLWEAIVKLRLDRQFHRMGGAIFVRES